MRTFIFSAVLLVATSLHAAPRRHLRVVLYPFVPERRAMFEAMKKSFEAAHKDIALTMIDLFANYYDGGVATVHADVIELDSVFIDDFTHSKIQPLPQQLVPQSGSMLPVAEAAVREADAWFGLPHWICSYFLYFDRGDRLASAATLHDVVNAVGKNPPHRRGLLIDLKGKLNLGELYLRASGESPPFDLTPLHDTAIDALREARALCEPSLCRDDDYHRMDGFYARQFARKEGRAFAGYSELLYYVAQENATACRKGADDCNRISAIDFVPLPLTNRPTTPLAWVDALTISKTCIDQCLADATEFIRFVASPQQVDAALVSTESGLPRFLLPALVDAYSGQGPLYAKFRDALTNAVPARGPKLSTTLRTIGKTLDETHLGH